VLFLVVAYRRLRRALEDDQRVRPSSHPPLVVMLLEEVVVLARRVGRWRVGTTAATVVALTVVVQVVFADWTPGPVLDWTWRLAVSGVVSGVAIVTWAAVHALRRRAIE
jgi:hypothetical protein